LIGFLTPLRERSHQGCWIYFRHINLKIARNYRFLAVFRPFE
jgi:hypothetical protein